MRIRIFNMNPHTYMYIQCSHRDKLQQGGPDYLLLSVLLYTHVLYEGKHVRV